jgi:hypothetical protein
MIRLFLLLALVWSTGAAQDGPPKTVKEIRQLYADTQKAIAMMDEEEHLRYQLTMTHQCNNAGAGIQQETITGYYYEDEEAVNNDYHHTDYRPYFIIRKYNVGARKFYEEYLFHAESGEPVFVFLQCDSMEDAGKKDESRYYYGPGGLISENIKGERILSDFTAKELAAEIWSTLQTQVYFFHGVHSQY